MPVAGSSVGDGSVWWSVAPSGLEAHQGLATRDATLDLAHRAFWPIIGPCACLASPWFLKNHKWRPTLVVLMNSMMVAGKMVFLLTMLTLITQQP